MNEQYERLRKVEQRYGTRFIGIRKPHIYRRWGMWWCYLPQHRESEIEPASNQNARHGTIIGCGHTPFNAWQSLFSD